MSEIDDLLQAKLEALEGGKRLDQVLTDLPPDAEELVPLVKLASAVRELAHPQSSLNGSTARQLVRRCPQAKESPLPAAAGLRLATPGAGYPGSDWGCGAPACGRILAGRAAQRPGSSGNGYRRQGRGCSQ